ncbi:MAG: transaldolase [Campylobacter sp.]|nr:transaldolase [Campylobacter sp.]
MYKGMNFSLWCDFIERDFLDKGFSDLLRNGTINGATSNPAIFKTAFSTSKAYEKSIEQSPKRHPKELYELLASQDIKIAAQKLLKNYANGDDGFISIEVDPNLSSNVEATIAEGVKLYNSIKMPNVMIKIPATKEGYEAMSALMAQGINVNATLIFSPQQAISCLKAFKEGTQAYLKHFTNTTPPQGVISIFVSRFDRLLDEKMAAANLPTGQIGIMNASKIYHIINDENLPNVRALFASTGVKGGDLRADYYVRELMFENTINTAPVGTIEAFIKENAQLKTPPSKQSIQSFFEVMAKANINIDNAYRDLLNDGLKAFEVAFGEILNTLNKNLEIFS